MFLLILLFMLKTWYAATFLKKWCLKGSEKRGCNLENIFHKSQYFFHMRHGRFVSSYRQNYSMKQTWILNKSE